MNRIPVLWARNAARVDNTPLVYLKEIANVIQEIHLRAVTVRSAAVSNQRGTSAWIKEPAIPVFRAKHFAVPSIVVSLMIFTSIVPVAVNACRPAIPKFQMHAANPMSVAVPRTTKITACPKTCAWMTNAPLTATVTGRKDMDAAL